MMHKNNIHKEPHCYLCNNLGNERCYLGRCVLCGKIACANHSYNGWISTVCHDCWMVKGMRIPMVLDGESTIIMGA